MIGDDHLLHLRQADHDLLALFAVKNELLRNGLTTLARLGVAWRRAEPDRCRSWLAAVEPHPFFKGGQTLFDLLEFEDFMLDAPDTVDGASAQMLLDRLTKLLGQEATASIALENLPALEPGFYLYRDVVLGVLRAFLFENVAH